MLNVSIIPLALYIHIPWCVRKCPYCDFNSHQLKDDTDFTTYVDALLLDAKSQVNFVQGRKLSSIFIGGGTPSILPIDEYHRLFDGLRALYHFVDDIEVTMEANPATIEHAPFAEYLAVGINRLSIGVQTFNNQKLKKLGRIHDASQASIAIKSAKQAGFKRINVDLMHGLPNQSVDEAIFDINQAVMAGATHISWYQLTIEPNTIFYRDKPILPNEDTLAKIEIQGSQLLHDKGFKNYEVSAWVSTDDEPCRHNINYWKFGDYLAIGAGAHGKVSLQKSSSNQLADYEQGVYRFSKSRLPKDYVNFTVAPKQVGWQKINEDDLLGEFMLDSLRLSDGITIEELTHRTGIKITTDFTNTLNQLKKQGLLFDDNNLIRPTNLGRRFLNQLIEKFI